MILSQQIFCGEILEKFFLWVKCSYIQTTTKVVLKNFEQKIKFILN